MYQIVHDGRSVGLCDEPRWVARHKNGSFVETTKEDATHVAIGGEAYNLDETLVIERDGAEFAFNMDGRLSEVSSESAEAQDALCEVSGEMVARLADIEDALCEITKEG